MARVPREFRWTFPDVDAAKLDVEKHSTYILARILEFAGIAEVRWALKTFGPDRIHQFLRDVGHPELSPRTLAFWRAYFNAENETWASPPDWRRSSFAPWPS